MSKRNGCITFFAILFLASVLIDWVKSIFAFVTSNVVIIVVALTIILFGYLVYKNIKYKHIYNNDGKIINVPRKSSLGTRERTVLQPNAVKESNSIDSKIVEDKVSKEMNRISKLNGFQFEKYFGQLLGNLGYSNIDVTQKSSDQGIDIVAEKNGIRYGFQCKHYQNKVGNKAIQEIYAGLAYYQLDKGVVVTTSSFTASAIDLAKKTNIGLYDYFDLKELVKKSKM